MVVAGNIGWLCKSRNIGLATLLMQRALDFIVQA